MWLELNTQDEGPINVHQIIFFLIGTELRRDGK